MSKYNAKKTYVGELCFASKREATRYKELKLLELSREIKNLELQPEFELQPRFEKNGKIYRPIKYIADFSYFDIQKRKFIVEDSKGFKNKTYLLKKKLFEYKYQELEIMEV